MEVADELVLPQAVSPSAPQLPPGPQGFKDIVAKKQLDDPTKAALDAAVKQFALDFAAKKAAAA